MDDEKKAKKVLSLLDSSNPHEAFSAIQRLKEMYGSSIKDILILKSSSEQSSYVPRDTQLLDELYRVKKDLQVMTKKYNEINEEWHKAYKSIKRSKKYYSNKADKAEEEARNKHIHNDFKSALEEGITFVFGNNIVPSEEREHFVPMESVYTFFKTKIPGANATKVMFSKEFRKVYGLKACRGGYRSSIMGVKITPHYIKDDEVLNAFCWKNLSYAKACT